MRQKVQEATCKPPLIRLSIICSISIRALYFPSLTLNHSCRQEHVIGGRFSSRPECADPGYRNPSGVFFDLPGLLGSSSLG